eukprot:TRINITY_DN16195_c0_g1_i1.p2 TRINITY_DN16195_c0_g1~~TRINITY_DN16195_c0_g1_i1.p2  ORF type:complete len:275 (+),score=21.41 TRINITY_DN16195_c0_g1_i1:209-1033(+)
MSLYNGPPRGGSRGGKDQFSWDQVKSDKDREYYLGHSVKALTGRWQKGKDVYWYTRDKQKEDDTAHQDELRAVKEREEQLMAEALGLKPKAMAASKRRLDSEDMTKLLGRSGDANAGSDDEAPDDDHHRGLGHGPRALGGVSAVSRLDGYDELHGRKVRGGTSDAAGQSSAPSDRRDDRDSARDPHRISERVERSSSPPRKRRQTSGEASPMRSHKKHKSEKKAKKHKKHKKEKRKYKHSDRDRSLQVHASVALWSEYCLVRLDCYRLLCGVTV